MHSKLETEMLREIADKGTRRRYTDLEVMLAKEVLELRYRARQHSALMDGIMRAIHYPPSHHSEPADDQEAPQ